VPPPPLSVVAPPVGCSAGGLPRRGGRAGDLRRRSLSSRGGGLCRRPGPGGQCPAPLPPPLCVVVPGRAPANRAVFGVGPARPEKMAIGSCLGRQSGTTPDTARHEESIGPHSVEPHSAGPFRARARLGPGGPFGIYYLYT
jgi:hypothetical protein